MTIIEQGTNQVPGYGPYRNAGFPTNGTSGTLAGIALKGALLLDTTNGVIYINSNTQASPTWSITSGLTQQANIAAIGATSNITSVPGSFADLAAVQTYLAGAGMVPRIESRLDAIEAKVDAVIAALVAAGVLAS
jgi:hypothetical protein